MIVELNIVLVLETPPDKTDLVERQALARQLSTQAKDVFLQAGYKLLGEQAVVVRARREQVLLFTPRKKHLRVGDRWLCTTNHISVQHLIDDPKLVTCKLCQKELRR